MTQTTAVVLHAAEAVSSQFGALAPRGYTPDSVFVAITVGISQSEWPDRVGRMTK